MPIRAPQQPRLRLRWTLRIASVGLLAGMAMSPRLWIAVNRLYPRAPIVPLAEAPLAAERVLRLVATQACRAYLPAPGGTLLLLGRPDWLNGRRARTTYECVSQVR